MNEPIVASVASKPGLHNLYGLPTGRFRPLARLLSNDDFTRIVLQPGMSKAEVSALRRERRAMLLAYLRDLRADSIAAWRLTASATGKSQWSLSATRSRLEVELVVLRIAANVVLHHAGWARISAKTFQLTIELARLQLRALRLAF